MAANLLRFNSIFEIVPCQLLRVEIFLQVILLVHRVVLVLVLFVTAEEVNGDAGSMTHEGSSFLRC